MKKQKQILLAMTTIILSSTLAIFPSMAEEVTLGAAPNVIETNNEVQIGIGPEDSVSTTAANIIIDPSVQMSSNNNILQEEEPSNTEEQTSETNKSYTDEDYQYLVMVLTGECQSYPAEIQKKYGSVVLNRVKSPLFPNTIKEVCLQKRQYSCFRDGNAYRTPTEASKEAAKWLLENGSIYPDYVIYQSRGKQGKGVYEVYKGEYFCY